MKVWIDPTKCQGHNRCVNIAPDLFELDALGYSHEREEGEIQPDREEAAKLAAANCPERAVVIDDTGERRSKQ